MADVEGLLSEAASKIKREADRIRKLIDDKEAAFEQEIGPLREELRELEAAIARIEGRGRSTTGSSRAPRGSNRNAILKVLDRKSGQTAAEIADKTGISKATVHATLAKLTQDGHVAKAQTERGVEHRLS